MVFPPPGMSLGTRSLSLARPTYGTANLDDQHSLCGCVVGHLLHFIVALIHIKLVAATQTVEVLSIAIPIVILAFLRPGHVHQVEVQVTSTARSNSLEININNKCLLNEGWVVEVVGIAVVCGELVQEVQSERAADTPL